MQRHSVRSNSPANSFPCIPITILMKLLSGMGLPVYIATGHMMMRQCCGNFSLNSIPTSPAPRLESILDELLGSYTLPPDLNPETLKQLPAGPGVYLFYGDQQGLLYIGKSINVRSRVRSHFSGDHTSTKELTPLRKKFRMWKRSRRRENWVPCF